MAKKSKEKFMDSEKIETNQMNDLFSTNYVTYNGNLSVEGSKLVNQYGDEIQLRGFSTANADKLDFDFDYYYNSESISTIKSWGANLLRLVILPKHYINNSEFINEVYKIIDICIKKDMYIIVDWHTIKEGDPNIYLSYSEKFFNAISAKYSNIPNIIYEICNEPNSVYSDYEVNWNIVCNYVNNIIPIIRKNSNNSIIIVGTPDSSTDINSVINNRLEYFNIMYTLHLYPSANETLLDRLTLAYQNELPIFVTEWAHYDKSLKSSDELIGNKFINAMNLYNISWAYFELCDDENITIASVVKDGKWNNKLPIDTLSDCGIYVYNLLMNDGNVYTNLGNVMMTYNENYAFWNPEYREKIISISFRNIVNMKEVNNSIKSWDVSYVIGNNKVFAYIVENDTNTDLYDLYIVSDGGIFAPRNSTYLFSEFPNLTTINFENFNTDYSYNMNYMFYNNSNLISLDLSNFNTEQVHYMGALFANCTNLINLSINSFNTSNVEDFSNMFNNCQNIETLDLSNFNTSSSKKMNNMFYNCNSLINLNLNSFNTNNVTSMYGMFQNCSSLENLDISNFSTPNLLDVTAMFGWDSKLSFLNISNADFSNVTDYMYMFSSVSNNITIYVKDSVSNNFIKNRLDEVGKNGIIIKK